VCQPKLRSRVYRGVDEMIVGRGGIAANIAKLPEMVQ
jgi:hypothetical protein